MDEVNRNLSGEAQVRAHVRAFVRRRPWLALAAAAAAGGTLGGIAFSRAGRLAFAVATGFVAHDLWHREGRLAVDEILSQFTEERDTKPGREPPERGAAERPRDR